MITLILCCSTELIHNSFSQLMGAFILELCFYIIVCFPFYHKDKWTGFKGYLKYIWNFFTADFKEW